MISRFGMLLSSIGPDHSGRATSQSHISCQAALIVLKVHTHWAARPYHKYAGTQQPPLPKQFRFAKKPQGLDLRLGDS